MAGWPDGFDLDALLAACPGAAAVGTDLREDYSPQSPYYRLRDARASARTAERQIDAGAADGPEPPNPAPFWRIVRELGSQMIAERSKDLELASWLTECLVRAEGVAGLAAGASLIAGLTRNFWDEDIFPRPDEDGMETRVAPVTGLNGQGGEGTLIQPLRLLAMCRDVQGETIPYYKYKDAAMVAGLASSTDRQARYDRGSLKFDEVEQACRAAGATHFGRLLAQVEAAAAAWADMTVAMDEKAGTDSPSTSTVRDLLAEIREAVARYAPMGGVVGGPAGGDDAGAAPGVVATAEAVGTGAGGGPARVVTREDMLRDITRIAAWFRANEPQSPMGYTLDEAVRRGRMTWPELLVELVYDASSRNAILANLGIKPPAEE